MRESVRTAYSAAKATHDDSDSNGILSAVEKAVRDLSPRERADLLDRLVAKLRADRLDPLVAKLRELEQENGAF
jgi:hypothetical protein